MTEPGPIRIDVAPHPNAVVAAIAQLPLADRASTLVVNGGTAYGSDWPSASIKAALRAAVIELITQPGPVIVSGGTQAGIFSLLGEVIAETTFPGPVIGVAPAGQIDGRSHTRLERHHSHILVVDVAAWGDETPTLIALVRRLHERGPVVALIAGGGKQTIAEVEGHLAGKTPVIALRGTRRSTDELIQAADYRDRLIIVDVTDPDAVAQAVREALEGR